MITKGTRVLQIRWEFQPQDLWIGVFWRHLSYTGTGWPPDTRTDVWICLLPCLPLHLWWERRYGA